MFSRFTEPFLKRAFLSLSLICSFNLSAQLVINLEDGKSSKIDDLLAQGKVLIFFENDCAVCAQYINNLKNCPEPFKTSLRYVSVSTPVQTKEFVRKLKIDASIYLLKNRQQLKSVYATPTTLWSTGQKVGLLSCEEVGSIIQRTRQTKK